MLRCRNVNISWSHELAPLLYSAYSGTVVPWPATLECRNRLTDVLLMRAERLKERNRTPSLSNSQTSKKKHLDTVPQFRGLAIEQLNGSRPVELHLPASI